MCARRNRFATKLQWVILNSSPSYSIGSIRDVGSLFIYGTHTSNTLQTQTHTVYDFIVIYEHYRHFSIIKYGILIVIVDSLWKIVNGCMNLPVQPFKAFIKYICIHSMCFPLFWVYSSSQALKENTNFKPYYYENHSVKLLYCSHAADRTSNGKMRCGVVFWNAPKINLVIKHIEIRCEVNNIIHHGIYTFEAKQSEMTAVSEWFTGVDLSEIEITLSDKVQRNNFISIIAMPWHAFDFSIINLWSVNNLHGNAHAYGFTHCLARQCCFCIKFQFIDRYLRTIQSE